MAGLFHPLLCSFCGFTALFPKGTVLLQLLFACLFQGVTLFCVFPVVDRQCLVLARQCRKKKTALQHQRNHTAKGSLRQPSAALKLLRFALGLTKVRFCSEAEELGKAPSPLQCRGACPQGRTGLPIGGVAAVLLAGLLVFHPSLKLMVVTKENVAAHALRSTLGPTVATRGSTADGTIPALHWTFRLRIVTTING